MNQTKPTLKPKILIAMIFLILLLICGKANVSLGAETYENFVDKVTNYTVIEISNEEQLRWLAKYTNNGGETKGKTFNITNDIYLSSMEWQPIGNYNKGFDGTINGNGHTISGMVLTIKENGRGFVGYNNGGTIKNIVIGQRSYINLTPDYTENTEDFNLTSDTDNDAEVSSGDVSIEYQNIGGVVGYNYIGTIENCINKSNIKGAANVGGIVGTNYGGTIKNCSNEGIIGGFYNVGGIVGVNTSNINNKQATIKYCNNKGMVNVKYANGGGIAGKNINNCYIGMCFNKGNIVGYSEEFTIKIYGRVINFNPQNIGGIVGAQRGNNTNEKTGTTEYSYNDGSVSGYKDIGGIVGQHGTAYGSYSIIQYCSNNTKALKAYAETTVGVDVYLGYIAGNVGTKGCTASDESTYTNVIEKSTYQTITYGSQNEYTYSYVPNPTGTKIKDVNSEILENINNMIDYLNNKLGNEGLTTEETATINEAFGEINSINSIVMYSNKNRVYKEKSEFCIDEAKCYVGDTIYVAVNLNFDIKDFYSATIDSIKNSTLPIYFNNSDPKNMSYSQISERAIIYKYKIQTDDIGKISLSQYSKNTDVNTGITAYTYSYNYELPVAKKINNSIKYNVCYTVNEPIKSIEMHVKENGVYSPFAGVCKTGNTLYVEVNFNFDFYESCTEDQIKIIKDFSLLSLRIDGCEGTGGTERLLPVDKITPTSLIFKYEIRPDDKGNISIATGTILLDDNGTPDEARDDIRISYNDDGLKSPRYTIDSSIKDVEVYITEGGTNNKSTGTCKVGDTVCVKADFNFDLGAYYEADKITMPELKITIGSKDIKMENKEITATSIIYKYVIQPKDIGDISITNDPKTTDDDELVIVLSDANTEEKTDDIIITYEKADIKSENTYKVEPPIKSIELYVNGKVENVQNPDTYKLDDTIYIAVNFNFNISEYKNITIPKMYIKFGEDASEDKKRELSGEVAGDSIIYKYKIKTQDIGAISIDREKYIDNKYIIEIEGNALEYDISGIKSIKSPDFTYSINKKNNEIKVSDITSLISQEEIIVKLLFYKKDINGELSIIGMTPAMDKNGTTYSYNIGTITDVIVGVQFSNATGILFEDLTNIAISGDRISPVLQSMIVYSPEKPTIKVDTVENVKERYNPGEKIKIVATFNEDIVITEVPKLYLTFGGQDSKGTVGEGILNANTIKYEYTITSDDNGEIAIKGFKGKVFDLANNETILTKVDLQGDTIIADTTKPILEAINMTNYTGRKVGETITFEAIYNEEVYTLESDNVTELTSPELKIKIGPDEKTATRGQVEYKNGKTIVPYTYTIQNGDNGDLSLTNGGSLICNVCDIAGNKITETSVNNITNEAGEEAKLTVDTTAPTVTFSATVDKPIILGTAPYFKEGNEITIKATFSEEMKENIVPSINVKFGAGTVKTVSNGVYDETKKIVTYKYTITDGDNGNLVLGMTDNQAKDLAENGNTLNTGTISTIIADTIKPYTSYSANNGAGINISQDNQRITIKITYSEDIYDVGKNNIGELIRQSLVNYRSPKIRIKFATSNTAYDLDNGQVSGKNSIYYSYSKTDSDNGDISVEILDGIVYDRAGNSIQDKSFEEIDTTAPVLQKVEFVNIDGNEYNGKYYLNKDKKLKILLTYDEKLSNSVPTLSLEVGSNKSSRTISSGIVSENTIMYEYTVNDKENETISIASIGAVTDLKGNKSQVKNNPTIENKDYFILDTIKPKVTITPLALSKNTTNNYTFTIAETNLGKGVFTANEVDYTNSRMLSNTYNNNNNLTGITLLSINDANQQVYVLENIFKDLAGNGNEASEIITTKIDTVAPALRIKNNGGSFVKPTDTNAKLETVLVVNENLSKFEYIWSTSTTLPTTGWSEVPVDGIQVDSDVNLSTNNATVGNWYLYVRATDEAGNVTAGRSKEFAVKDSKIILTPDKTTSTKENVNVTVAYGECLTQNRFVGLNNQREANLQSIEICENGTLYAEATDTLGNKVYTTLKIENIDKTAPELTVAYSQTDITNNDIIVTITANEEMQEVEGWVISADKLTMTKTYTENKKEEVIVKDLVGNESKANISIENIDKTTISIKSHKYLVNMEKGYIARIPLHTTAGILKSNVTINAVSVEITDNNGKTVSDVKNLATGMQIKFTLNNQPTVMKVVVKGDVNGDSEVDFKDILQINKHRLGKIVLEDIYAAAGDVDESEEVNFADILKINKFRLGKIESL